VREYLDGFGHPYDAVGGNHDLEGIDEFQTDEENLEAYLRIMGACPALPSLRTAQRAEGKAWFGRGPCRARREADPVVQSARLVCAGRAARAVTRCPAVRALVMLPALIIPCPSRAAVCGHTQKVF
jgi:hypothetical protein